MKKVFLALFGVAALANLSAYEGRQCTGPNCPQPAPQYDSNSSNWNRGQNPNDNSSNWNRSQNQNDNSSNWSRKSDQSGPNSVYMYQDPNSDRNLQNSDRNLSDADRKNVEKAREALRTALKNSAPSIVVVSRDGILILTGLVNSEDEKTQAETAVLRVDGVKSVKNNLEVKSNTEVGKTSPEEDKKVTDKSMAALKADSSLSKAYANIRAKVENGTVLLYGTVSNESEKAAAEKAVLHVEGVKSVINRLEIK